MPTLTNLPLATTATGSMIFAVVDGTATKRINIDAFKHYMESSLGVSSVAGRGGDVVLTYSDISGLATIAHSGSYNDLSDKPATFSISTATSTVVGGVKVAGNGSGISITGDGTISVSTATASLVGGVKIGSGISISGTGTISVTTYTLTSATSSVLGGVKIGTGIAITGTGYISVSTATSTVVGGVKVAGNGNGISISGTGTISLSTATTSTVGGVKVDGTTVQIDGTGVISSGVGIRSFITTTTTSLTSGTSTTSTIAMAKGYALYAMLLSTGSWVTLYTSSATMISDYSRAITTDPTPGSGVIAEAITTASGTVLFTPGVIGYNSDTVANTNGYLKIYNNTKAATTVSVTLAYLKLEV